MKKLIFVGRQKLLEKLRRLLRKKTASLVVIRGRRRIGKSRLVEEFAKTHTFYTFTGLAPTEKITAQLQREEFARQLQKYSQWPEFLKSDDWGTLFTILAKITEKGSAIILLDEISWMGSKDPTFLGKLKIAWDTHFSKNPNLILILCGSVSYWIEKNIISSTGFFGRISQKIFLEELSISNANQMLTELGFKGSALEKFMLFSIMGGIPWYLELINPSLSAVENIKQLCFEKDGILFDEYKQIFHDLFGKRSDIYGRIIKYLASASADYKEVSQNLKYSSGGPLSEYLNELTLSGFIEKDYSWSIKTGKERRIFRYRLSDNYLRFYLKYVEPNYNKIKKGIFSKTSISSLPGWETIMGFQFENLVLHNRNLVYQKLNIDPTDITYDNPYFQKETLTQKGCQIDYLIQTRFNTIYLCKIKFSKNEVGMSVIEEVKQKIKRLKYPKGFSILPVLIYVGRCSDQIEDQSYFVEMIDFCQFLN
ncbi:MAG: hypothetical protein K940chlam8_00739 [Chlamydiae bacterium]|nr:hypothetical protein [Chlamydiota bacterium]